ncbi:FAD:protein FMN transferase [Planotetraspora kaengkrachanensis]|uniref:FAD:protein FMN transferase n=1 Tax=Planotetraspora kaengkrachanensis TaxID=575193 RepID=A0A8J3V7S2_9ACTN|nr:FAD:protein FMN transferase [Planotetraspora kaengkrachanensis]GIG81538.1 FAD:protein FMN transferase [Planotetraspora kaengkrachanensis]
MGTVFSFDVRDDGFERAVAEAVEWLHRVDETFSTYRPESVVSRLDRGEITLADCPPEVVEVLRLCDEASRVSRGYFTPRPGGRLDPSAVVKGWAIERASRILTRAGAANHCVNGGGDVQLAGSSASGGPWRVGIAHPLRPGELAAVVTGRDLAVATSGTAERGAHIIDPHTGRPATALASITLIGESLTMTDTYATAAFAMGDAARDWVGELEGFEAFAVTASGATWHTGDFPKLAVLTD